MNEVKEFMPIIIYFLSSIVLIALVLLIYKVIKTLEKIDNLVDDINQKSQKLNFIFNLFDKLEFINDRIIRTIITGVVNFFEKKGEKKERRKKDEA